MSGGGDTAPRVVEDYRGVIKILSDGTIVRSDPAVLRPPERFPDVPGVQWEDVVYDAAHGLKLRVYRSAAAGGDAGKLPVLVYFHSGGFCLGTFEQPNFHSGCLRLASELPAVVLSADYRLGPEQASTPEMSDTLWRLSLPAGATRDHPAANPFGPDSPGLEPVAFPPVLVVSAGRDILHERALRYAARLKGMGKPVELAVLEGQEHAFFSRQPWGEAASELIRVVKSFVLVHKGDGAECT